MRTLLAMALTLLCVSSSSAWALDTIYVVRHSQKLDGWPRDRKLSSFQPLSEKGRQRSAQLAEVLAEAGIAQVYTSATTRTAATGFAVSNATGCPLTIAPESTDSEAIPAWLDSVISAHVDQEAVLIVGHSNTVPLLLQALGADDPCLPPLGMTPHEHYGYLANDYDQFWTVDLSAEGCDRISVESLSNP